MLSGRSNAKIFYSGELVLHLRSMSYVEQDDTVQLVCRLVSTFAWKEMEVLKIQIIHICEAQGP